MTARRRSSVKERVAFLDKNRNEQSQDNLARHGNLQKEPSPSKVSGKLSSGVLVQVGEESTGHFTETISQACFIEEHINTSLSLVELALLMTLGNFV